MRKGQLFDWSWEMRPATVEEYERMIVSLDRHLASLGFAPAQRPLNAALVISSVLGLSGTPIIGGSASRGEPFSPPDLLARVHEWYWENYGDRTKIDFSPGSIVVSLHGNFWEMKMPKVWGSLKLFIDTNLANRGNHISAKGAPPVSHNILRSIEGMTQAYAARLSKDDLLYLASKYVNGYDAVVFLDDLQGHDLFEEARGDYRHGVSALMTGRELGKARWDMAQCAEKVMKGLLAHAGHTYPKFGSRGHDIEYLGGLVRDKLGVDLLADDLRLVHCTPAIRYGEEKSTAEEAFASHEGMIRLLNSLAQIKVRHV